MSRSNQVELRNPAKKFLQWKGEVSIKKQGANGIVETNKHNFSFYDKEKKENIEVALPITFIVLDVLHTIKGFCESANAGFYSNEIRTSMFKSGALKVRLGKHDEAEGLYADIMPSLKGKGAKYCQSVYVLMKEGTEWVINNIQIQGASVGPWVDFCKNHDVFKCAVTVKEFAEASKGTSIFNVPIFKEMPVSPETEKIANEKDVELQDYLEKYFKTSKSNNPHEEAEKYLEKEAEEYEVNKKESDSLHKNEDYATDLPF